MLKTVPKMLLQPNQINDGSLKIFNDKNVADF